MDVSSTTFQPAISGANNASGTGVVAESTGGNTSGTVQNNVPATPNPAPQNIDSTNPAPASGSQNLSAQQLAQAIKQVNDTFTERAQDLYATFAKDPATGTTVIKIIDKNTKDVVSQIPTKEMLAFAQLLDQSQGQRGQLLNVQA
ncbi:MAG: flagellar protein FlaG [Nitrosomonadales bacterium]